MNRRKEENLDRLLRDWATGEQPDQSHLEMLHERIAQAADQLEGAGAETSGIPDDALAPGGARKATLPGAWPTRLGWFALGAAAAILAAVFLLWGLGTRPPVDTPGPRAASGPPAPPEARLSGRELAAQATVFAAMREVFADQLAWMAEADGKVILGIEPEAQAPPAGSDAITIRLVVMARRSGEADWRPRWSVDCIVHDEQLVELPPQDGPENRLAVWTHLLPDGMIAVDTSLGIETSQPGPSSYSGVQRPEVPQQILTLKTDGTEYQVFQTVAVLPKEVG